VARPAIDADALQESLEALAEAVNVLLEKYEEQELELADLLVRLELLEAVK
jgi:hypothetical protein